MRYLKGYLGKNPGANIDRHAVAREGMFRALPAPRPGSIVFVGDSLTSSCEWQELFGRAGVVLNRGVGGDTSAGVLKRVSGIAALRPEAVFLMIGTNDAQALGYSPGDTLRNYQAIIQELRRRSPGTRIYLQSLLPTRTPKFNRWSDEVNRGMRQLADGDAVVFIDLRPAFLDSDQALDQRYTYDGIHLSGAGYVRWKQELDPLIQQRIGSAKPDVCR